MVQPALLYLWQDRCVPFHDQFALDVSTETAGFVEKLFECLTTKNYLGNPPAKEIPKEEIKPSAPKPEEKDEVSFIYM